MPPAYLEIPGGDVRFVADAHFRSARIDGEASRRLLFISFVESLPGGAVLFLLGDIFDFYFEYRRVVSNRYLDIFAALSAASARGVRLHFLGGNHDFWVGRTAEREFGLEVHHDEILVASQGRRIRCAHGDLLMPGDRGYKMLKSVIRNPVVIGLSRWIHPDLLDAVASGVSHGSRSIKRENHERQARGLVDYAHRHFFDRGNDAFIMGHVHHPLHDVRDGHDFMILGDWIKDFTYGRLANGTLSLERFTDPSTG
jgi:UDP-2,3-diacylglucosamine hydrolase